jgi:CRISPR-associated protein Csy1
MDKAIEEFFEDKDTPPKEWIAENAKKAWQINWCSHPAKFSHPSAGKSKNGKTTVVLADSDFAIDGYVRTGNVSVDVDADVNAAAMQVLKFLKLELEDGRSMLEHIERDSTIAKELLGDSADIYDDLKKQLLKCNARADDVSSSSKLKQVYFPVDSNSYHLLSILSPSGTMFELRKKIRSIWDFEKTKVAKENRRNNRLDSDGYDELYNVTMIGFGGTKPQNISVLNNENGGKAYLLDSQPPSLREKNIRLPARNFFDNCLWPRSYETSFHSLHALLKADINNIRIREGRNAIFQYLFDRIIEKVWQIRTEPAGWSDKENFERLPMFQKVVLDSQWDSTRESHEHEIDTFIEHIVRWMLKSYRTVVGNNGFILGDEVMTYLVKHFRKDREVLL